MPATVAYDSTDRNTILRLPANMAGARGGRPTGRGTTCSGVLLPVYFPAGSRRSDTGGRIAPALGSEKSQNASVARHSRRGILCRAARKRKTGRFSGGYHTQG